MLKYIEDFRIFLTTIRTIYKKRRIKFLSFLKNFIDI